MHKARLFRSIFFVGTPVQFFFCFAIRQATKINKPLNVTVGLFAEAVFAHFLSDILLNISHVQNKERYGDNNEYAYAAYRSKSHVGHPKIDFCETYRLHYPLLLRQGFLEQ